MKRFLAILLAVAMMAGMLSVQALAVEDGIPVQEVIPIETPQTPDATNSAPESGIDEDTDPDATQVEKTWGSDYDTATEFTISTEAELRAFAKMANEGKDFAGKTVKLTENIVLTGEQWIPIAAKANTFFAGTFDGQGNTISGLTLTLEAPTADVAFPGLFGKVSGTIQNVILEDINISSPQPNGGIASVLKDGTIDSCSVSGQIQVTANNQGKFQGLAGGIVAMVQSSGTIKNCKNEADLSSQGGIVAGIAGRVAETTITNCTNYGDIEGRNYLGGIVGQLDGTVSGCENNGTVTSNASTEESLNYDIGGIAGNATVEAEVSDCINNGAVTAEHCNRVGGIVGYLYAGSDVTNCKNTASVTGNEGIGGVVGYAAPDAGATANFDYGYSIISCANSGSVSGEKNVGGVVGIARGVASQNESMEGLALEVSSCTNEAAVSGTTNVGGIVGSNNAVSDTEKYGIETATEVSGCINTGRVPEGAGTIVGNNNDQGTAGTEAKAGIVQNNFWPAELGEYAVGSGAGSSDSESSEAVKNNSSYQPDGTLTTPVTDPDNSGNTIGNLGEAIDKIIGNGDGTGVPDMLKVTVTYCNGGHGTAPVSETVTKGSKVTLPPMSNDGYYTFTGWSNGGATYTAGQEVPVMEDMTFTAQWRNDTPSTGGGGGSSDPTYSISLPSKVTGGEVSIQKRYAEKGETVTITVTPDDGYELDELIVTDSKGNELDLTDKGNGKFTFKMPAGRVEIEVSFQEIVIEPVNPFVDVSTSDYYYDAVLWAVENGVTNGTSATTFGPNMAVSRAQMVTFLWRAHGSPKATGTNPFTDVSTSDYYYDAVLWAVANGVTNGTSATTFSPDTAVTRSQAVTFQWRAAGSPVVSGSSFGDVATDAYYVNAVTWAVANGITNGTGGNTFSPDVVVSRAQAVTFLYREQE